MSAEGEGAAAPDIRIVAGAPTTEELAALTAVLAVALDGIASESRREPVRGPSQWELSRRAPRRRPAPGAWGHLRG
ncbi:acyl-CoA carboxylase epsilon subunit [Homoserinibacter sp. YIM 151385]|uniref:acyl-CoA carboxylase epsilon subunit n=1 Tax=Homoserinibacter sp. YIM 151385 TaxID=2985506 RepID=UPI0022F05A9A|nr:acyl-CoA carboxylase epsilon subunit [Homoserinibacter sp. YIM 151385]WBU36800.1 acyl-CoA carboxylase epsilon subunit [Homoserinibacter sp. YIM 151385]